MKPTCNCKACVAARMSEDTPECLDCGALPCECTPCRYCGTTQPPGVNCGPRSRCADEARADNTPEPWETDD